MIFLKYRERIKTMKLIIDIDEKTYKAIKSHAEEHNLSNLITEGIPLEDIKAEIDNIRDVEVKDGIVYVSEDKLIELLDKK